MRNVVSENLKKKTPCILGFQTNFWLTEGKTESSSAHQDIAEHKQNQEDCIVPPLEMYCTEMNAIPQPRYLPHTNKICWAVTWWEIIRDAEYTPLGHWED